MRKLKLYLDTSVISYLKQDDSPTRTAETRQFWNMLEDGVFDVCLSQVTLDEIAKCHEPKRSLMYGYLANVDFSIVSENVAQETFAQKIIDAGLLKERDHADCMHIAAAVEANCDCVVSWNFKHLVNIKTIQGVREISIAEGEKIIDIVSPVIFLNYEEVKNETDAES